MLDLERLPFFPSRTNINNTYLGTATTLHTMRHLLQDLLGCGQVRGDSAVNEFVIWLAKIDTINRERGIVPTTNEKTTTATTTPRCGFGLCWVCDLLLLGVLRTQAKIRWHAISFHILRSVGNNFAIDATSVTKHSATQRYVQCSQVKYYFQAKSTEYII